MEVSMGAHMDGRMRRRTLKQIAREAEAVAEEADVPQIEHLLCTREASDTAAPAAWSSNGDASAKEVYIYIYIYHRSSPHR